MSDSKTSVDPRLMPRTPTDTSLINQHAIDIKRAKEDLNQKVDVRNTVTYTFKGTGVESFDHKLGRVPVGRHVVDQSNGGVISGDNSTWTSKKIFLRSSVAGNKVTFLFH